MPVSVNLVRHYCRFGDFTVKNSLILFVVLSTRVITNYSLLCLDVRFSQLASQRNRVKP